MHKIRIEDEYRQRTGAFGGSISDSKTIRNKYLIRTRDYEVEDPREKEWTSKVSPREAQEKETGKTLRSLRSSLRLARCSVYGRVVLRLHLPTCVEGTYVPNVAVVRLMLVISACRLFNGPP